jgi:hypothetical protein
MSAFSNKCSCPLRSPAARKVKISVLFRLEQRHIGGCVTLSVMEAQPGATLKPTENVMNKLLTLAAALLLAFASTLSTAQAGMRGVGIGIGIGVGLGAMGAMSNSGRGSYEAREYRQRKKERSSRRDSGSSEKKVTSKKSKSNSQEAKSESKTETADAKASTDASIEPSSIAGTAGESAPAPVDTGSTDTAAAQTENSSISLAAGTKEDTPKKIDTASTDTDKTATKEAKSLDCKKFFPSAGMTLSVPCE